MLRFFITKERVRRKKAFQEGKKIKFFRGGWNKKTHPEQGAAFKIDKFVKMSAVQQGMGLSFLEVNGDVYVV